MKLMFIIVLISRGLAIIVDRCVGGGGGGGGGGGYLPP